MIELRNVSKRYKRKDVVKEINLMIPQGACVGLVGPNGAGKSTLMKMIATLVKPNQGQIYVGKNAISKNKKRIRKKIGYVPQEIALHTSLSVRENIYFWAGIAPGRVNANWVQHLVSIVGLTKQVDKRVDTLSGGMQRKLNILVAMLHNPDFLIMDEPTVGIDLPTKMEIISFLRQLAPQKTLLFSSHELQEIEMLCQFILVLDDGMLRYFGTIRDLPPAPNPTYELLKRLQII